MKADYNQFLAVAYSDIFDWPLKPEETYLWQIKDKSREIKNWKIEEKDGYCFLPGRGKLLGRRLVGEKISDRRKMMAEVVASFLVKIPTVGAIFLTGSVAVGNAKKNSDIDLMVVTAPATLWLTRSVVFMWLKLLKSLRSPQNYADKICPNIFLDTDHLGIEEKNLYTAHEVLQAQCLFDRGGVEKKWLKENEWVKKYLPKAYAYYVSRIKYYGHKRVSSPKHITCNTLYILPELIAFFLQYLYMKNKITSERVGWGYAFFHPNHLAKKVEDKFARRLVKYTG